MAWGCNDFLDEVDQDKIVPEKTDHYAALLLQEFNVDYPLFSSVDHMTDNIVEVDIALSSVKKGKKPTYTWQREIEIDEDGNPVTFINNAWEKTYEDIAIVNYVIELIDEAQGTPEEVDYIKGEAYFIRALSYFNLTNLYGEVFNPSTAGVDLGVPLRTDIGVETHYYRNSVAECYLQIEEDLVNARELLITSGIQKAKWHPSVPACDLLMSRVKLYQESWDEVIDNASSVIDSSSLSRMHPDYPFITENNNEVLYSFYTRSSVFSTTSELAYKANDELIDLYDENDLRLKSFFDEIVKPSVTQYHTAKYKRGEFTDLGYGNFRTAEAYLNRAEAYVQLGNVEKAIEDMKSLLESRYTDASGIVYPTNKDELLKFILTERRKEFCFEDHHRWFDLRRMKNRPEIKHVYSLVSNEGHLYGKETFTLLANDPNYNLPIPLKERANNSLIRNNERYEKLPQLEDYIIVP